jgi:long-chain acyl-CoA synthetase
MLYARWRQIAATFPNEVALTDVPQGRQWTFGELAAVAEHAEPTPGPVAFPQGMGAEFVIGLLAAWRTAQVVCPVEVAQVDGGGNPGATLPSPAGLPEGIVHLKTTSASTGEARFVAFKAEQLMADAENIVATMGLRADWPNLGAISLAHSYGFSNLVLPLLLHGIPLTLAGSALPESLAQAAKRHENVTLAAVPALWRAWDSGNAIPPNVRLAISAGAPLPVPLEQMIFAMRGLKLHNFYGSSECGGIAYDSSSGARLDDACVGAPMRNVQVAVGEDGCLEVRGRNVGETYWPEPGPALAKGVFRTSDLGELSFGMVYLRGRATDLVNVAGRKVSPETIERALNQHPGVSACLVFGVPSTERERGETIVACVPKRPGVTPEALKQFLLERLPAWQIPREWWLVEALEVSERGKLSRADWRKRFLEASRR